MIELLNQLNTESESYGLIFEPGYVVEIQDKKVAVGLNNRLGRLEQVQIVGPYFPVEDDKGLIIYAGKFKLAFFLPQLKENMNPGSYGTFTYSNADVSNLYSRGDTNTNRDLIIEECKKYNLNIYETACVLANAEGEVGTNLIPIVEGPTSNRQSYWYGRGIVQLTGEGNYIRYNSILKEHFKDPPNIVENPDAVLNNIISIFILVHGMVNGNFTSKKISDYVNSDGTITNWGATQDILRGNNAHLRNDTITLNRTNSNINRGLYWVNYLKNVNK